MELRIYWPFCSRFTMMRLPLAALYVLGAALFIAFTLCFFSFTVDDAFISFRYARNFIDHGIWNWNADHDYVEAYTSGSYAFLAVVPLWLHLSVTAFFKTLGIIIFLWIIWRIYAFSHDRRIGIAIVAFLVINPRLYVHCFSCLETPLFIVLSLELYAFLLEKTHNVRFFYGLLLLLPLTRPEGGVLALLALAWYANSVNWRLPYMRTFAAVLLAGGTYFVWRWQYFGYLLPNTFYAKKLEHVSASLAVTRCLDISFYVALIALLINIVKRRVFTFIGISASVLYALVYIPSTMAMNFAGRFGLQTFLPVILMGATCIRAHAPKRCLAVYALFTLLLIASYYPDELKRELTYGAILQQRIAILGESLRPFHDAGYTLMIGDAGVIPYYADWKAYDMQGLANATIAHHGLDRDYLADISPDVIILYASGPNPSDMYQNWFSQRVVWEYMQGNHRYAPVAFTRAYDGFYGFSIYMKKDLALYAPLKSEIEKTAELSRRH